MTDVADLGERQLLDDARAGCGDAFASLWRIYQPQVLRFLRARGTSSPDDVASQVWLDIDRTLNRFDGDVDAFRGTRHTSALRYSYDDPTATLIVVSEDGPVSVLRGGERLGQSA